MARLLPRRGTVRALAASLLVAAGALLGGCGTGASDARANTAWAATWYAAPQVYNDPPPRPQKPPKDFADRTYRQTMRLAAGGSALRFKVSNVYGTRPLAIAAMQVAPASSGTAGAEVRFDGRREVTLQPGEERRSDEVPLAVAPLSSVVVTTRFGGSAAVESVHTMAFQRNTLLEADASAPGGLKTVETGTFYYGVTGIDARSSGKPRVVVCFGASITDGNGSTVDANRRYPDVLAELLVDKAGAAPGYSVVNAGISGNRWTFDVVAERGTTRFARDVLDQPGATDVIINLGINDIGVPSMTKNKAEELTADAMARVTAEAAAAAKKKGLRVYVATLGPFGGTTYPGYYSADGEAKRQQYNDALRRMDADGVIDFDLALRDPSNPTMMLPAYDSGDHLHPSDAGYRRMAEVAAAVLRR